MNQLFTFLTPMNEKERYNASGERCNPMCLSISRILKDFEILPGSPAPGWTEFAPGRPRP